MHSERPTEMKLTKESNKGQTKKKKEIHYHPEVFAVRSGLQVGDMAQGGKTESEENEAFCAQSWSWL